MQHGPKVFIVDNDAPVRRSLGFLLQSAGFAVADFASAEAFQTACHPAQPGCLILDVRLPGMSGLALQEQLMRSPITLPIIVISGYADVGTAVCVLKRGAFDFIEKPVIDEVLLERVRQAIAVDAQRRSIAAERARLAARMARLTARERAVFDEVVHGKPNKVVALEFGISEKTVESHRARVMSKLEVHSLADLVRMDLAAARLDVERGSGGRVPIDFPAIPALRVSA